MDTPKDKSPSCIRRNSCCRPPPRPHPGRDKLLPGSLRFDHRGIALSGHTSSNYPLWNSRPRLIHVESEEHSRMPCSDKAQAPTLSNKQEFLLFLMISSQLPPR